MVLITLGMAPLGAWERGDDTEATPKGAGGHGHFGCKTKKLVKILCIAIGFAGAVVCDRGAS